MKDKNVYCKKDNGRYEPFGIQFPSDYLSDGIWYVRHNPGVRSITNGEYLSGLFKVGQPEEVNLTRICGMQDLYDKVMHHPDMEKLLSKGSWSIVEIVSKTIAILTNIEDKAEESADSTVSGISKFKLTSSDRKWLRRVLGTYHYQNFLKANREGFFKVLAENETSVKNVREVLLWDSLYLYEETTL